jgi:ring-1,2-phenylacetyl-CoA epoxidase subunit PaaD
MSLSAHLTQVEQDWHAEVWRLLGEVPDPEIPVLSILDLGIVRYVRGATRETLRVGLTPTYSACPATEMIQRAVSERLVRAGFAGATVETVLSPPWSSDAITAEGRAKLAAYGIAPPAQAVTNPRRLFAATPIACPRCASTATRRVSEFGSTPCKAHYTCTACLEPFDYFKCI